MDILFVCTGNTCRSPMAEAIYNKLVDQYNLDGRASSAGIFALDGGPISEKAIEAMSLLGVDISSYRSKPLSRDLLDGADIILTMSQTHKLELLSMDTSLEGRVFLLNDFAYNQDIDIGDPYGLDLSTYIRTRDEIYNSIKKIIETRR